MSPSSERAAPSRLVRFASPLALLAAMWVIRIADDVLPGSFTVFGLRSWDAAGLVGVVAGPLLHSGWPHLLANSAPFLILGWLVAVEGAARFWTVTAVVALVAGAGTWAVNTPGTVTVGASGLVFGYVGYIVARVFTTGRMAHRFAYAIVAILVVAVYGGSVLTGVLPLRDGVSWQAHLFGAIGGVLAAVVLRRRERPASS